MRKHNRPNRIVEIWWTQYKLVKVVDKYAKDVHHIISRKNKKFNIKEDDNKITIFRRTHVALNNLFWDKQSPKEQLRMMLDIWKTALSENVRQQLYDILDLSDELFYNKTLLKCEKKKKKKGTTNTATHQGNANTI